WHRNLILATATLILAAHERVHNSNHSLRLPRCIYNVIQAFMYSSETGKWSPPSSFDHVSIDAKSPMRGTLVGDEKVYFKSKWALVHLFRPCPNGELAVQNSVNCDSVTMNSSSQEMRS
ncbi:hypothetical protein EJB05_14234, partial [Eragrostis curvula]